MKKLFIIMLAVLTAAVFAGCSSTIGSEAEAEKTKLPLSELDFTPHPISYDSLDRPDSLIDAKIDPMYLPDFKEIVRPADGGSSVGSYYLVVTDAEELARLTGDLTGKTKNAFDAEVFQRDFVVAVFVTVATGGYTVELDKAYNDGNTVTVKVKVTPPNADFVTEALETYCVLVAFDRGDFYADLSYDITVNDMQVGPFANEA